MKDRSPNKIKTINDPVYGFITLPFESVFDIIEHPWFQRLRRIRQLGLTHYVYPSAHHTRFQHALGCMHLMNQAIHTLRSKGISISNEEAEGACQAILLHDIGHGPFSHTLEKSIIQGLSHEELSGIFIRELSRRTGDTLELALKIFTGEYHRKFLHQLVSSQLDMDRLDYLSRDSFFTGVAEGTINTDRIIHVLTVSGDELAVEPKGIYSVEKFLVARRLMYWQVYLHKTVLAADQMLIGLLRRAKYLGMNGVTLMIPPPLEMFFTCNVTPGMLSAGSSWLEHFAMLDDFDIVSSVKRWIHHPDPILSELSEKLINRKLFRVELRKEPFDPSYIHAVYEETSRMKHIHQEDMNYFIYQGVVTNDAYRLDNGQIFILTTDGSLKAISEEFEQFHQGVFSSSVSRYFLAYPKEISLHRFAS